MYRQIVDKYNNFFSFYCKEKQGQTLISPGTIIQIEGAEYIGQSEPRADLSFVYFRM